MARTAGAGGKGIAAIGRRRPGAAGDSTGITATGGRDVLSALHGTSTDDAGGGASGVITVRLDDLVDHPRNPRQTLGDLSELVASIRSVGVIQPLAVASRDAVLADDPELAATVPDSAAWVIVAGHRRAAASREAGRDTVDVIVRDDLADSITTTQIFLIENLQRRGLDPLEEADGYARLRERGLSQRRIAEAVGVSQGQVSKRLALLDLPMSARAAIAGGGLAPSAALRLLDLPEERRGAVMERAQSEGSHGLDAEVSRELSAHEEAATTEPVEGQNSPAPVAAPSKTSGSQRALKQQGSAGGQASGHRESGQARLRACRRLVEKQLTPTAALDILADAVLTIDAHRVGKRLRNLVQEWTGVPMVVAEGVDADRPSRSQTHRVAVATALAAFEIQAGGARYEAGEAWPPHIQRYIRRLEEHGVHELSIYERDRLPQLVPVTGE